MKMNRNTNIIGKKVKLYRENKNWSYEEFSKKLEKIGIDIKPESLKNIEMKTRRVTLDEFVNIAECLSVSLEDLIDESMVLNIGIFC